MPLIPKSEPVFHVNQDAVLAIPPDNVPHVKHQTINMMQLYNNVYVIVL